jgi:hypothetical protein
LDATGPTRVERSGVNPRFTVQPRPNPRAEHQRRAPQAITMADPQRGQKNEAGVPSRPALKRDRPPPAIPTADEDAQAKKRDAGKQRKPSMVASPCKTTRSTFSVIVFKFLYYYKIIIYNYKHYKTLYSFKIIMFKARSLWETACQPNPGRFRPHSLPWMKETKAQAQGQRPGGVIPGDDTLSTVSRRTSKRRRLDSTRPTYLLQTDSATSWRWIVTN